MTLTLRETAYSVFGVLRLACFDPTGMDYLDRSALGALRSFWAAAIVLPGYVVLVALDDGGRLTQAPLLPALMVEAIAYVVGWTAFPLLMHYLSGLIGRGSRYTGYLCAYNWSAVVQVVVFVPVALLSRAPFLAPGLGPALLGVATIAVLVYQWFIARTALELPGGAAASIVFLDVLVSALLSGFADSLL